MFYQFTPQSEGWKQNKKDELATELARELKLPKAYCHLVGQFPFIEVDRFHNDVTISRVTHLTDKQREKIVEKADRIYEKVMELKIGK